MLKRLECHDGIGLVAIRHSTVVDNQRGKRKTKDGGDMDERPVDMFWFVGRLLPSILLMFIAEDAEEFAGGTLAQVLEAHAQGTSQRTAFHLPELADADVRGVGLQGCAHRGEEGGCRVGGSLDEQKLVFQGVDGIDDVVVAAEVERISRLLVVDGLNSDDVSIWVDGEQPFAQTRYLGNAHSECRSHELTVDVAGTDNIAVDDGQMTDARTDEGFGTP